MVIVTGSTCLTVLAWYDITDDTPDQNSARFACIRHANTSLCELWWSNTISRHNICGTTFRSPRKTIPTLGSTNLCTEKRELNYCSPLIYQMAILLWCRFAELLVLGPSLFSLPRFLISGALLIQPPVYWMLQTRNLHLLNLEFMLVRFFSPKELTFLAAITSWFTLIQPLIDPTRFEILFSWPRSSFQQTSHHYEQYPSALCWSIHPHRDMCVPLSCLSWCRLLLICPSRQNGCAYHISSNFSLYWARLLALLMMTSTKIVVFGKCLKYR